MSRLFREVVSLLALAGITSAVAEPKWLPHLEYGKAGGESLRLDASVPPGEGPFPIAILIHGGGWGSGDKAHDFGAFSKPLTDAGFTWFSINYRLAPQHRWPACFEDVQAAIRWVKAHAATYKGDPQRIALIGYSAGGQLAALAAIRADETTRVQAVVGLAPAVELVADSKRRGEVSPALRNLLDLPEKLDESALARIAAISPAEEIKPGLPPFLLVQGTADQSVRHVETVAFSERLKQAKVPCDLIEMKDAPHRIAEWPKFAPGHAAKTIACLKAILAR
jgi:acetyl esterase/lipase